MSPRTGRPRAGQTPNINLRINPDAYHAARIEAVTAKKTVGQWLEEAINEKIDREKEVAAEARQAVYRSVDQDQVTSEKANPLSILAQLGSQGLPIDESHASLGMVYTNPPEMRQKVYLRKNPNFWMELIGSLVSQRLGRY